MNHFTPQRQGVFLAQQEQPELVTDPDVGARRKIRDSKTAQTYV